MKNKTVRFLIVSIICIMPLCVLTFSYMTYKMNRRGAGAIGDLGVMYMEGMSEQAASNFGVTIDLKLSQVGALADSVAPDRYPSEYATKVALGDVAKRRGFTHLALYAGDGSVEMIYGSLVKADAADVFLGSLGSGERVMAKGSDESGKALVLMGIPASYSMKDKNSIALVAALPISYVADTIALDGGDTHMDYFIIEKSGMLVTSDIDLQEGDLFDYMRDNYEFSDLDYSDYVRGLKDAMKDNLNYSGTFTVDGERCYQYAVSLPSSEWYLLLNMPYGRLDRTVDDLGRAWRIASISSCCVVLSMLFALFITYLLITRRYVREIEESRRAAEHANKAKSEFLSNMSHDIRTPMNGIVGMTAIAAANVNDPVQVENCLKKIDISSRHLLNLINDILDMSKIESGKLELHPARMSLKEAFRSVVNIVQPQANAKEQKFEAETDDLAEEFVLCDLVRFNQILLNLLGNAVKFTPSGGSIGLYCTESPSPVLEGAVRVVVRVTDTGIGMSEEFITRIFDAFAREDDRRVEKTEGTGLGMAITKYIVDAMHGSIDVKSKPNVGSEFTVTLDLGIAPGEATDVSTAEVGNTDLAGRTILLAEDNDLNREIAVELLSEYGLEIDNAEDGKICAEKFAASPVGHYSAILMDIRMPVMDGYAATRAIRAMDRADAATVPIIAMSADAFSEDVQKCLDCGMNAHTPKPIDINAVTKLLMKFIGGND